MCLELPGFALSAALVVLIAVLIGIWPWGTVLIVVWLASGPLILLRSVEDAIMRQTEDLRAPTLPERVQLEPAWLAVADTAGVSPAVYSIWIQKSRRINAYATAGHTVAITEAAVQRLDSDQLEAILAHELGHHLGGHAWASLLRYWYSLPAQYVFQFATYLSLALSSAMSSESSALGVVIGALVLAFVGFLIDVLPLVGVIALILVVVPFGLLWVRRRQEYEADAIAAQLGYGPPLARLLLATDSASATDGHAMSRWWRRIGDTHPLSHERAKRLRDAPAGER